MIELANRLPEGWERQGARALAYAYRGVCLVELGDPAGLEDCEKGVAVAPDYADPYLFRAMALVRLDRWDDGERDLVRAVECEGAWLTPEQRKQILQIWRSGNYALLKLFLVQFQEKVPKDMQEQVRFLTRVIDRHLEKK